MFCFNLILLWACWDFLAGALLTIFWCFLDPLVPKTSSDSGDLYNNEELPSVSWDDGVLHSGITSTVLKIASPSLCHGKQDSFSSWGINCCSRTWANYMRRRLWLLKTQPNWEQYPSWNCWWPADVIQLISNWDINCAHGNKSCSTQLQTWQQSCSTLPKLKVVILLDSFPCCCSKWVSLCLKNNQALKQSADGSLQQQVMQ